jgi:type II secretory pathway pseudopilin PulG
MRHALHKRGSSQRGAALLLVVVVIAVLAIVAFAVIQSGSNENDAVAAKRHYDQGVTCADAAREMLLSQFRTYGASPTSLTLDETVGGQRMTTGHFDNLAITSVSAASGYSNNGLGASDISNRIVKQGLGGTVYRMTVVCSSPLPNDAGTRQSEVEFVAKFGL